MLHDGDDDAVSGLEQLGGVRRRDEVDRLGGVANEDEPLGRRIDETSRLAARACSKESVASLPSVCTPRCTLALLVA